MSKSKILILCGGGSSEHEISIISAKYLQDNLPKSKVIEIQNFNESEVQKIILNEKPEYIIPCFHGHPGETGEIQPLFEKLSIPYLGCDQLASQKAFDKIQTKQILDQNQIPNSPYTFLESPTESRNKAHEFFSQYNQVYIKAASQGSSVGCYPVKDISTLDYYIDEAFKYSPRVLIEKSIRGRELEVSVFEYDGKIHATPPGEIILKSEFYSYEEKYDKKSTTVTHVAAKGLSDQAVKSIISHAKNSFKALGLRHLSRIDFFISDEKIYLNEINTFPGMTPISMFPKMMEQYGVRFSDWIQQLINK